MASFYTEEITGGQIKIGSTTYTMTEIKYGANLLHVWPTSFTATLTCAWVSGGQYSISQVPAGGGYARADAWVFKIFRAGESEPVHTATVTPTVRLEEMIDGQRVTAQNFSYTSSSREWKANNRGRNGDPESGPNAPTNAPQRSCYLTASFQMVYQGVTVSASSTATMTQLENQARQSGVSYSGLAVSLAAYGSTSNRAPAYESSTTVSASLDKTTNYTYDSGDAYARFQQGAITSSSFTFSRANSSDTWITVNGTSVKAASRGTDNGDARQGDIKAEFSDLASNFSITGTVTLYQEANKRYIKSTTLTSYDIGLAYSYGGTSYSSVTLDKSGGYVYVSGTAYYSLVYGWPSLAPDSSGTDYGPAYPTTIAVSPSSGVEINYDYDRVKLPANVSSSDNGYTITGSYYYNGVTKTSSGHSATVTGIAYSYAAPSIGNINYAVIPASGGTVYPSFTFDQKWYIDGVEQPDRITGSILGGATSGTASDGSTFTVSYSGTGVASNGGVSASSKGTTPSSQTNVASVRCTVTCNNMDGTSSSVTVVQSLNRVEYSRTTYTGATMSNIVAKWSGQSNNTVPSAGGQGTLTYSVSRPYIIEDIYTSNAPKQSGSGTETSVPWGTGGIVVASQSSWITEVTSNSITTEARESNYTSSRTGTVSFRVYYNSVDYNSFSLSLTQNGTVQTFELICYSHPNGVTLPAYASSVNLTFRGLTHYDNGAQDGVTISPGLTFISGSDVSGRITRSNLRISGTNLGANPYPEADTSYTWRWTNHTSASCTVAVMQVHNQIEQTEEISYSYGTKQYGASSQEVKAGSYYASASLSPDYSSINPAPKGGTTATLTASAGHEERTVMPWTRTDIQTLRYTWTSTATSTGTKEIVVPGTDYTAYAPVSDTPNIVLDPTSMLSRSGNTITVSPNSGDARFGIVYVNNGSHASDIAYIYQRAGNIAISVDNDDLSFSKSGGTQRVVVTAVSTGWTLTSSKTTDLDPFLGGSISPSRGNAGNTTVTITIARHQAAQYGDQPRRGIITITSTEDSTVQATILVFQEPAIDEES